LRVTAIDLVAGIIEQLEEELAERGRPRLREWRDVALLPRVHAVLLRMTRSSPEAATRALDIVVDSCSVRAKHGSDGAGGGKGAGRGVSLPSHRRPDPIRIEP
jgi:hypothetical protein